MTARQATGLGIVFALVVVGRLTAAPATNATSPKSRVERMISIPGSPLPPVDESTIRMSIQLWEPILAGVRFVGTKAAIARGIGYLAMLHAAVGDHEKADPLFDEARAIMEKHGATNRDLAWLHNNRGLGQLEEGRYAKALRSFRAALAAVPPDQDMLDPHAKILQNLGTAQQFVGDFEGSEQSYLDALDTLSALGTGGMQTSQTARANLAVLYGSIGDHERARKLLVELLKAEGLNRNVRFAALNDLGFSLAVLKDYPNAERRLVEAMALSGGEKSRRAVVLQNLASVHFLAGNYERARQAGEEALPLAEEVHGTDSRTAAALSATLGAIALVRGDLVKADVLLSRSRAALSGVGGDRDALGSVITNLAIVAQRRGERGRALDLSRQALAIEKENFDRIVAFGSEAQRLAYRNSRSPYDQLANLGDPVLLADAVLAMKGAVLESLLAERVRARKSTSPADRERLDRIHVLKVELMEKIARGGTDLEPLERSLKQEETALARSLAGTIPPQQRRPDLGRVQARLGSDQVLVEIVRYQFFEQDGRMVWSYGGLVIARTGPPKWVPLGRAEELDGLIEHVLRELWPGGRGVDVGSVDRAALGIVRELEERLWKPLERAFPPGTREVRLSPDGATHFVPWAALLDEHDTFVAERFRIAHVASGRDLLREGASSSERTILALADGKGDLPHTRSEVKDLAARAKTHGWRTTVLQGELASETELLKYPRPRILHFATHGAEFGDDAAKAVESRLSRNPMYRSYLILGGGAATIEAWNRNDPLPFFEDGILTAEEVGGLNLRDNWLTVLSACRTGRGDARTGEGVIGLRRSFALAGAENLLFTLADVDDAATAQFMAEFYRRLFETSDLAGSFQDTQCAELVRWKREDGVRIAVQRAGAFVLMVGTAPR